jgi:hypothetical protein
LEKNISKLFFTGELVDWEFQHKFVEQSINTLWITIYHPNATSPTLIC